MAKTIQFEGSRFESDKSTPPHCQACKAMLADALDGTLGPVDQAWFDRHTASCGTCADMLADAQRGAAWLGMLKSARPEPRPELLNMILAHVESEKMRPESTTVFPEQAALLAGPTLVPAAVQVLPANVPPSNVLPMRPRGPVMMRFGRFEFESRLAMTAAMAFFSVALTLNLAGVHLNQIKASSMTPTGIRRSFYDTNARVVRYYDNLRAVQMMEARVDTLRTSNDDQPLPAASGTPLARPETARPATAQPDAARPDAAGPGQANPGPGSRNAPPALLPGPVGSPLGERRNGQPNLFLSPARLRLNAGELV